MSLELDPPHSVDEFDHWCDRLSEEEISYYAEDHEEWMAAEEAKLGRMFDRRQRALWRGDALRIMRNRRPSGSVGPERKAARSREPRPVRRITRIRTASSRGDPDEPAPPLGRLSHHKAVA